MKRDCQDFAVELSAYFDNELNEQDALVVEAHLAECANCRGDLEKMGKLRAMLNAPSAPTLPEEQLIQDLMRALRGPEPRDGRDLFGVRGRSGPALTRER
jgi:predicted anti-sigma-YlaC factor YlaD